MTDISFIPYYNKYRRNKYFRYPIIKFSSIKPSDFKITRWKRSFPRKQQMENDRRGLVGAGQMWMRKGMKEEKGEGR